jgi:hypothetical protein
MLPAALRQFVVREIRYKLVAQDAVSVHIDSAAEGESERLNAKLIDISTGGLRISSNQRTAEGDLLTVTITTEDAASPITVRAQVCWTTLAAKGRFYLGCSIEPAIPQSLLEHLATSGILERRQEARQESSLSLPARWELDPAAGEAAILNLSSGGISLLMPQPGNVGRRICLTLLDEGGDSARIYVKARWQIQTPDGTVVGCAIPDRTTYLRLSQMTYAKL